MELAINVFIISVVLIVVFLFLNKKRKNNKIYKMRGEKIQKKYFEVSNEFRKFNDNEKNNLISNKIILLSNEIIAFKIMSEKELNNNDKEHVHFKENMLEYLYIDLIVYYLVKCKIVDGIVYNEKDFNQFKRKKYFDQVKRMLDDSLINIGLSKINVYNELKSNGKAKSANEATKKFYVAINKQIEKQKKEINKRFNKN